ncbi:Ras GTPase-activating protein [Pelomyxa schiedti]|nr:Ras GTPase-activating protein [Pelomyxa schiedti]
MSSSSSTVSTSGERGALGRSGSQSPSPGMSKLMKRTLSFMKMPPHAQKNAVAPPTLPESAVADMPDSDSNDEDETFLNAMQMEAPCVEQVACLMLLLKSRMMLRRMIAAKQFTERLSKGDLNAFEVTKLVQGQDASDDSDFIVRISELKKQLMAEIRKARDKEREVAVLDKTISLVVLNVVSVAAEKARHTKAPPASAGAVNVNVLSATKLEKYSHLFHLLQSEPVYLARLMDAVEAKVDEQSMKELLDTIIITMYGDAFAPREEFLLLSFFEHAIERIMSQATKVMSFVQNPFLPPMVITYNKRKQGVEYLQATLGPVMKQFLAEKLTLDPNARTIHDRYVKETEVNEGRKVEKRNLTDDECAALPEIKEEVSRRLEHLKRHSLLFFEAICSTVNKLPYGLRWICKRIHDAAMDAFPDASEDDINRLTVHFVYFRFINLGIVTPDPFKIVDIQVPPESLFSLLQVSKVIYNMFNLSLFHESAERWLAPLNPWIMSHADSVRKYLHAVLQVDPPEEYLQVGSYMELMHLVKPVILVEAKELVNVHTLLQDNLTEVALKANDPLLELMKDLGPAETYPDDGKAIQLTLVNKFPPMDDPQSEINQLYSKTKTMVVQALRQNPSQPVAGMSLEAILEAGQAAAAKGSSYDKLVDEILENLEKLEREHKVSSEDGYAEFLKAVTLEITNRERVREQQKKEVNRLEAAINQVGRQLKVMTEQIAQYKMFLDSCLKSHMHVMMGGATKTGKLGPFKFSYLEMVKRGVIIESEVPKYLQKKTRLQISSEEAGVFDVEVMLPRPLPSEKMQLQLADLLDKRDRNVERDVQNNVTLDVNLTLHWLNSLFKR